jgi:DNA-binding XRE family transcriptional regulator
MQNFSRYLKFFLTPAPDSSYLRHMSRPPGRPRGLTPDGPKIHSLRIDRGLTIRQLAAQICVHKDSISQWEKGRPISDVYASRLAKALGVEVEDIADPPEALAS